MTTLQTKHFCRRSRGQMMAAVLGSIVLIAFRASIELGFATDGAIGLKGVPVEYLLLAFFATWATLRSAERDVDVKTKWRLASYQFGVATLGVTLVLWLAQMLWRAGIFASATWVYWVSAGSIASIFLISASQVRASTREMAAHFVPDVALVLRRPVTWALALAGAGLIALGPRSEARPTTGWRFERWFAAQPRVAMPAHWQVRPVTLVEFIDYQCRVCRQADARYRAPLDDLQRRYPNVFAVVRVEFPLENECNPSGPDRSGGRHPAACEAAVAVRLARERRPGLERQVIDWLWRHQNVLSSEFVLASIPSQFGLDLRSGYAESLEAIRLEAALARGIGVSGTPTYFLNGRRLSVLPSETMVQAVQAEIDRAALSQGKPLSSVVEAPRTERLH